MRRAELSRPADIVAPVLLGCLVRSSVGGEHVVVRLTEVEAYGGVGADPGSHAYRGSTPRTQVMFGAAGHAYVYFTYGMHWCLNVVCGPDGAAAAVLLRAGEVVEGAATARERRPAARVEGDLARGPARLAQALGVDGALLGTDLLAPGSVLSLTGPLGSVPSGQVSRGPRVGLSVGGETPWRFWVTDDPTVSTFRGGGRPRPPRTGG